jgi:hypothetical protein
MGTGFYQVTLEFPCMNVTVEYFLIRGYGALVGDEQYYCYIGIHCIGILL